MSGCNHTYASSSCSNALVSEEYCVLQVRFFYSFTCSVNLYLVMEYLNGGDVFSMLRNLGCLEEEMARVYIAELVSLSFHI